MCAADCMGWSGPARRGVTGSGSLDRSAAVGCPRGGSADPRGVAIRDGDDAGITGRGGDGAAARRSAAVGRPAAARRRGGSNACSGATAGACNRAGAGGSCGKAAGPRTGGSDKATGGGSCGAESAGTGARSISVRRADVARPGRRPMLSPRSDRRACGASSRCAMPVPKPRATAANDRAARNDDGSHACRIAAAPGDCAASLDVCGSTCVIPCHGSR